MNRVKDCLMCRKIAFCQVFKVVCTHHQAECERTSFLDQTLEPKMPIFPGKTGARHSRLATLCVAINCNNCGDPQWISNVDAQMAWNPTSAGYCRVWEDFI